MLTPANLRFFMVEILPFDQRDGFIWLDGELVEWKKAQIHVLNHGLHYASAVFEGTRMYGGKILKNAEHNKRLLSSARYIGYEIPFDLDAINEACYAVCKANDLRDAYIRPIAWLGSENLKVYHPGCKPHLAIAAWEWPSYYSKEVKLNGVKMHIAQYRKPDSRVAPVNAKASCLYTINTISKRDATQMGFDEALMLDCDERVAEATASNFFAVFADKVVTPVAKDRFLDGITRRTVMELCQQNGITIEESADLRIEDLRKAKDAFITGTAAEITRVHSIEVSKNDVINFEISPITVKLVELFEEMINNIK